MFDSFIRKFNKEKDAFFKQYAHCAEDKVLEKIWNEKEKEELYLDLSQMKISKLDPLVVLKDLTTLVVFTTDISDLKPLKHLKNLRILWLNKTKVSDLRPLKALTKLHSLYLSETLISDLNPLKSLFNLEVLRVSDTQINDLTPLVNLNKLQEIDISSTKVNNLAPLSSLSKLKKIDVLWTSIKNLHPLSNLLELETLSISFTDVRDLSPLSNLAQLKHLDFSGTLIHDLKPLKNLIQLQELHLAETEVSDLNPLADLGRLQRLFIYDSQVTNIKPLQGLIEKKIEVKWESWEEGDGIYIQNLSLNNPPVEIAKQGNAAILRYWAEQDRAGSLTLNEARLLIVGQGGAGKTTLRKKIMNIQADLPEPDMTTRGIDIETLNFKNTEGSDFGLHIWDFGGQNIQHYAHQFFLSDSVVYALVHSEREQNEHSSYWLSIIELLGKSSPVLIVQNEKYGHSEDLKNIAAVRERFPNVRNPIKLDLSKVNGAAQDIFKGLKDEIQHLACHLPHIGKTYLRSFNNVREQLKVLSVEKHSISWADFEGLCGLQGITDRELMRDYARYFHQLGICLWFEEDLDLADYVFLRPKWIIDALFELLYDGETLRKQAVISVKDVRSIWRGNAYQGMHGNLLRLMKNFEMCYDISTEPPQYIIPQLLPTDRQTHIPEANATSVVFQYRFLPKGFLTRLTCRLHNRIKDQNVWNDAVLFEDKEAATVFAKETYAKNEIELIAEGYGKRQLLNEVINTLKDINAHSKFANLNVEILVPCPCTICQKVDEPYQFEYDYLKRKLLKGQNKAECQKSLDDILIKDILREVNLFSFKQIREMVRDGYAKNALNLLRGRYGDHKEVILLQTHASTLTLDSIKGFHTHENENVAYQRLADKILKLLVVLEADDK
jgi:internalin A